MCYGRRAKLDNCFCQLFHLALAQGEKERISVKKIMAGLDNLHRCKDHGEMMLCLMQRSAVAVKATCSFMIRKG